MIREINKAGYNIEENISDADALFYYNLFVLLPAWQWLEESRSFFPPIYKKRTK